MPKPSELLHDAVATQREHSHVDAAVRARIGELILEAENEDIAMTGRRIAERLPRDDLAQVVADWLEVQVAI